MAAAAAVATTARCWAGISSDTDCGSRGVAYRSNCTTPLQLTLRGKRCGYRAVACQVAADGAPVEAASLQDVKFALLQALQGMNRGIFGVPAPRKAEIEDLLSTLEGMNPSPRPTENLDVVKGEWRLLYSTISILGVKRTKLGLRDFIALGDFLQIIDVDQRRAINKIGFNVAGLGMLSGALTVEASYTIDSPTRVNIQYENSAIAPKQLLSLFQKNYDLLLSIFNPEGWLEITYVDDTMRVGRDDKGNIFLVERIIPV
ncbi:hypothetical protein Mapa_014006 [Marchantia paleacea]|nr:hypothetical protein Mapa_014006 [Marchantia paleacea]